MSGFCITYGAVALQRLERKQLTVQDVDEMEFSSEDVVKLVQTAVNTKQHKLAVYIAQTHIDRLTVKDKARMLCDSVYECFPVVELILGDREPELIQYLATNRFGQEGEMYYVRLLLDAVAWDSETDVPGFRTANDGDQSYVFLRSIFDYDQDALNKALTKARTFRLFSKLLPDVQAPDWDMLLLSIVSQSSYSFEKKRQNEWVQMLVAIQQDERFQGTDEYLHESEPSMMEYVIDSNEKTATSQDHSLKACQLYVYATVNDWNKLEREIDDVSFDWPTLYAAACEYDSIETFAKLVERRAPTAQELVKAVSCTTSEEMLQILLDDTPAVPTWQTLMAFKDNVRVLRFLLVNYTFEAKSNPFKKIPVDLEIVQLFVDAGFDIKADGNPMLKRAAQRDSADVIAYVLSFGMDLSFKLGRRGKRLVFASDDGLAMKRAIIYASQTRNFHITRMLVYYEGITAEFLKSVMESNHRGYSYANDIVEERYKELIAAQR